MGNVSCLCLCVWCVCIEGHACIDDTSFSRSACRLCRRGPGPRLHRLHVKIKCKNVLSAHIVEKKHLLQRFAYADEPCQFNNVSIARYANYVFCVFLNKYKMNNIFHSTNCYDISENPKYDLPKNTSFHKKHSRCKRQLCTYTYTKSQLYVRNRFK